MDSKPNRVGQSGTQQTIEKGAVTRKTQLLGNLLSDWSCNLATSVQKSVVLHGKE